MHHHTEPGDVIHQEPVARTGPGRVVV